MYYRLKNQNEIISEAIKKAGSIRLLGKKLGIAKTTLFNYSHGTLIPDKFFCRLCDFLKINKEKIILESFPDNFRQIIGGKRCIIKKKEKGTFSRDMKLLQDIQSKKLKKWHKEMKLKNPDKYYLLQYSRFKKIGEYKFKTKKGEKVRNILEKEVADILYHLGINYQYEPLVRIKNRAFFPDFLIDDNIIIECTMWRGTSKAYKLKDKINCLKGKYQIYVVIPKNLYRYYETLKYHLVLGLDEFVPVAQTILRSKDGDGSNR